MTELKKVLVLGSGALKIGQAGEFDYSGSQALKALKEEGVEVVLINPNIATIQTSRSLAEKVYFLPITEYFVRKVIEKERPQGVLLSFGGQTALNCGLELDRARVFQKYNVQVLGTPTRSIEITEDRQLFAKHLKKIGVKVPKGDFATTWVQARRIAQKIGFPLIIRSAFSLGGLGSAVVQNSKQLKQVVDLALGNSPQVSLEEYLKNWKEVEYEVVRDIDGNKIVVCNMENLDPLGIHTGESIVVAPSQTLNNYQYHFLRQLSLQVIESLKIVGECNIQFAQDSNSNDYRVIEVNARLSRSSALASKATGYPLAYIAAKLGLGKTLPNLKNTITGTTSAFFEPSLDYVVIKIPRWDLQKFIGVKQDIGTSMKSVGEVMAIGRSFPEAMQKAVRMLEIGKDGLLNGSSKKMKKGSTLKRNLAPSVSRLFSVACELGVGTSVAQIYQATGIDPWFLEQIRQIVRFEIKLDNNIKLSQKMLLQAKLLGFSDNLIGKYFSTSEQKIRALRKKWNILPKVKHIDTLAAEYPAKTNYLYLTYHGQDSEAISSRKQKAIILGSGPYRIGSSVEFDWCCVTTAMTIAKKGIETVVINCNPETVSTDFDFANKLYFEELTLERVNDIYEIEKESGLVLSVGGQVPNNLALSLHNEGVKIFGTSPISIDRAENRHKFSQLLDQIGVEQPVWQQLKTNPEAKRFAQEIGYPVLVRPSYVLSGSAMNVAYSPSQLENYLSQATQVSDKYPVVLSKFIENAKEVEIDGVSQDGRLVIYAISEHVENAGIHSGDATLVLPPQRLYIETMRQIKLISKKIVKALKVSGPFNIQFLAKNNRVMVIELNLRASRSFPFVSKVTGYNFIEIASRVLMGENVQGSFQTVDLDYVGVKTPQFSFNRMKGADPRLKVEMSSTGEVACFGDDFGESFLKALLSTGWKFPIKSVLLSIGGQEQKIDFLESSKKLAKMNLTIYATDQTSEYLKENGIENTIVHKISSKLRPSVLDFIGKGKIDLVIDISRPNNLQAGRDGFFIRRSCADLSIPLFTNLQAAIAFVESIAGKKIDDLKIKSWDEYVNSEF